jgi:catechol 2,3-dioxygenase-like lactoylglutathione lyase family enzyme
MKSLSSANINHIGLIVSNIDNARTFYSDTLGLEQLERPNFKIKGLWYKLGECALHLMLHEDMQPSKSHPLSETVQPNFALALNDDDFTALVNKLALAKVCLIGAGVTEIRAVKQAFFYDPDDNMIEVNNDAPALRDM